MTQYYYSLIQYCPNLARLEVANIGLVLFCPDNDFLTVRLSQDDERINRMFKTKIKDSLFAIMKEGLRQKLMTLKSLDELNSYASMLVNSFRMTQFMPCRISQEDGYDEWDKMFDDLVN